MAAVKPRNERGRLEVGSHDRGGVIKAGLDGGIWFNASHGPGFGVRVDVTLAEAEAFALGVLDLVHRQRAARRNT